METANKIKYGKNDESKIGQQQLDRLRGTTTHLRNLINNFKIICPHEKML